MYGASRVTVAWRLSFVVIWEVFHLFCLGIFLLVTFPLIYARPIRIPTPFGSFKFHPIEVGKRYNILMHMHLFSILAPSKMCLSFGDGQGNTIDPGTFLNIDSGGHVSSLALPPRAVWISNHQLYTDWLYTWGLGYYTGLAGRYFICLKESLTRVPVLGPAMKPARFIPVSRNWERDESTIRETLECILTESGDAFAVLIYPEGTDLTKETLAKSQEFSRKNNFPVFQRLLAPRSTGLQHCVEILGQGCQDMCLLVRPY